MIKLLSNLPISSSSQLHNCFPYIILVVLSKCQISNIGDIVNDHDTTFSELIYEDKDAQRDTMYKYVRYY